jgi:hypothetical protein
VGRRFHLSSIFCLIKDGTLFPSFCLTNQAQVGIFPFLNKSMFESFHVWIFPRWNASMFEFHNISLGAVDWVVFANCRLTELEHFPC